MKKRLRRKLEKRMALEELANSTLLHCDECGAKYAVKDCEMTIEEEFFGTFTLRGFHPVCPNGCEHVYTAKLSRDERRIIIEKVRECLLKNYPPEKCEYLDATEIAELEGKSVAEVLKRDEYGYFPVFFIDVNHRRLYLKKSYDLYRKHGFSGRFDITVPDDGKNGTENQPAAIGKVKIIVE